MHIVNKNRILDAHYSEVSLKEKKNICNHINECNLCAEYSESLNTIEKQLDYLSECKPSEIVLTNILESIKIVPTREVKPKTTNEVAPFFHIALGLVFLSAFIYFIILQLSTISLWQSITQIFGSIGILVIIVFTIGTFITLALAPILIFESRKNDNLI